MKRRLLSFVLVLTLTASVISGALGVCIDFAMADTYDFVHDGVLYWSDFKSYISSLSPTTGQYASLSSIYQQVEDSWDDPKFNVFIMADNSGNLTFMTAHNTESSWAWKINFYNQSPIQYFLQTKSGSAGNCYYNQHSYIHIKEDVVLFTNYGYTSGSFNCLSYRKTAATDLANEARSNYYYPTPYDVSAGTQIFVLHDVYDSSGDILFHANISNGSYVPPVVPFSWLKFNIGDRWFITPQDQTWTYGLRNDGEGSYNAIYIGLIFDFQTEYDDTVFTDFTDYVSVPAVFVPGAQNVVDDTVYGFEITDFLDIGLSYIGYSWINRETENSSGEVINRQLLAEFDGQFSVKLSAQEDNQSLNDAWNQIIEYYNTYNVTHVVPEQLGDWLFDMNGSLLVPVNVNIPGELYRDATSGTAVVQHVWEWGGILASEQGFNYSLFDTVIMGTAPGSGVSLRYFYDDSLNPMYSQIGYYDFHNILHDFDVVIVVPDSEGLLNGYLDNIAYCGSSSGGVVYSSDPVVGNIVTGFAFITEKAIQKQHLWNFNDGITKLYELEVDYIDSEDKWKDSFLLWSASVFDMLNSLDGRLNSIYVTISSWNFSQWFSDLSEKLDRIADNTNEGDPGYWFLSLFNWVSRFSVSDLDFSNWVDDYDDFNSDIPDPFEDVTPIPIPLPTSAVG